MSHGRVRMSTQSDISTRERKTALSLLGAIGRGLDVGPRPSVSDIAREHDPFHVLVSTVLSLRTKDEVTMDASRRLFALAPDTSTLRELPLRQLERAIYPVGFYKTKARTLRTIAERIEREFDGKVPATVDELLTFKGVGRKTATLVVSLGFGVPAICVDTHVHRIANRLGLVASKTPAETETMLMGLLPRDRWIGVNELLVSFGQRLCTPTSPHCSRCPVRRRCPRVGVTRSR